MSHLLNKKELYSMRYPHGSVIELTSPLDDPYGGSKPAGARFEVDFIDDALQLHGHWLPPQSGCMAVVIGHDKFKIVE